MSGNFSYLAGACSQSGFHNSRIHIRQMVFDENRPVNFRPGCVKSQRGLNSNTSWNVARQKNTLGAGEFVLLSLSLVVSRTHSLLIECAAPLVCRCRRRWCRGTSLPAWVTPTSAERLRSTTSPGACCRSCRKLATVMLERWLNILSRAIFCSLLLIIILHYIIIDEIKHF